MSLLQIFSVAALSLQIALPQSGAEPMAAPLNYLIFREGEPVPNAELPGGVPTDAVFSGFGVPAIRDNGSLAFRGNWKSRSGRGTALFSNGMLAATAGDPVPGIAGATFRAFKDPVASDDGSIAVLATIAGATVARENNEVVVWIKDGGPPSIVAREGDAAPGANGATFRSFRSVSIKDYELVFLAMLNRGTGEPAVDATNDVGLWSSLASYGTGLRVREGDVVHGRTIRKFRALDTVLGSPGQSRTHLAYDLLNVLAFYTDGSKAVLHPHSERIDEWARTPYAIDALPGEMITSFGPAAAFSFQSDIAVAATLRGPLGASTAILAGSGESQVVVARSGDSLAGASGANFRFFRDPLYNGTQVAFPARLRGTGVTLDNDDVLVAGIPAAPKLLAREGAQAPEVPDGAVFRKFHSLALPRIFRGPIEPGEPVPTTRGAIFTATLEHGVGGVTAENDRGAWAVDSTGVTRRLFREGDSIAGKTLKRFDFLQAVSGSHGVTRAFNENYIATSRTVFTDGSSALMITVIPTPTTTP